MKVTSNAKAQTIKNIDMTPDLLSALVISGAKINNQINGSTPLLLAIEAKNMDLIS
jgi:hypothetical protein